MNRSLFYAAVAMTLAGCASDLPKNMPLFFAETITVGISVGATAAEQGTEFSLGVRTKDVAIVPVVVHDNASGKPELIRASVTGTNQDAYSVFGQFSTETDGSAKKVGLGKFFATGMAAVYVADGFANCMANGACTSPDGKPVAATRGSPSDGKEQKAAVAVPAQPPAGMVHTTNR